MSLRISDCGLRIERTHFESAIRNPQSAIASAVKHRWLVGGRARRREPEVSVRGGRGDAAARRAGEEALLHQERLASVLPHPPLPPAPRGHWLEAHRAPPPPRQYSLHASGG